jgi:hypothetical protein
MSVSEILRGSWMVMDVLSSSGERHLGSCRSEAVCLTSSERLNETDGQSRPDSSQDNTPFSTGSVLSSPSPPTS